MASQRKQPIDTFQRLEEFLGYIRAILERSRRYGTAVRYDLVLFFRFLIADDRKLQPEDEEWASIDISIVDDSFPTPLCSCPDLYSYITWLAGDAQDISRDESETHIVTTDLLRLPDDESTRFRGEYRAESRTSETAQAPTALLVAR